MNGIRSVNSDACIGLYQLGFGGDFLFLAIVTHADESIPNIDLSGHN